MWAFRCIGSREKFSVALIIIAGLLLRLYTASDPYLHEWDERYHALVAKNLIGNWLQPTLYRQPFLPYDYTNWGSNHIWLHKQPLALWLIAISLKFFGVSTFAVRIPSILLSTIGIKLMYDIGKMLFNKGVGFTAAFLFSIHGLIIEQAAGRVATDHTDVIFMFWILLSFWFLIGYMRAANRWNIVFAGLAIGAALLTKWLAGLVIVPLYIVLTLGEDSYKSIFINCLVMIAIACMVFLPWQWYIFHTYPAEAVWEYSYNSRHLSEALEGHDGNFLYHFDKLRILYGELVYIPCIWFTYKTIRLRNDNRLWVITAWFWFVFLFFSIAATKMPSYTIIASPAIFLITSYCFHQCKAMTVGNKYKTGILAFSYLLLLLPVRYAIERIKPFSKLDIPVWYKEIVKLQDEGVQANTVIFGASNPIELMFYTSSTAYSNLPDNATVKIIESKGYSVRVLNK
jgi:4-amino-4-deoxy-L-arabinose transferase